MKTRVITLTKNEATVKLIGCCHIGEDEYYKNLTKEIDGLVLYEGIMGTEGMKLDYGFVAEILGLKSQKDCLIYDKKNWINSDISFCDLSTDVKLKINDMVNKLLNAEIDYRRVQERPSKVITWFSKVIFKILCTFKNSKKELCTGFNFEILDRRNKIVTRDIKQYSSQNKVVSVLYGDGHLEGIVKMLNSTGWRVKRTIKYRCF